VATVGWYVYTAGSAPVAPRGTVVVSFTVAYKSNGSAKIKVKSSNGGILHPSRGHICYDLDASKCGGEESTVTWRVSGLRGNDQLQMTATDPNMCNSNLFDPQTLDANTPEAGPFPPNTPVLKQSNGKYCEFVYGVAVVGGNDNELGSVDPDIMPHGPRG